MRRQVDRELRNDTGIKRQRLLLLAPQAKYFNVGRIGRDQLEDLAHRKSEAVEELERWLAANLG